MSQTLVRLTQPNSLVIWQKCYSITIPGQQFTTQSLCHELQDILVLSPTANWTIQLSSWKLCELISESNSGFRADVWDLPTTNIQSLQPSLGAETSLQEKSTWES